MKRFLTPEAQYLFSMQRGSWQDWFLRWLLHPSFFRVAPYSHVGVVLHTSSRAKVSVVRANEGVMLVPYVSFFCTRPKSVIVGTGISSIRLASAEALLLSMRDQPYDTWALGGYLLRKFWSNAPSLRRPGHHNSFTVVATHLHQCLGEPPPPVNVHIDHPYILNLLVRLGINTETIENG